MTWPRDGPVGVFLEQNMGRKMRYLTDDQHIEETAEVTEEQRQC